MGRTSSRISGLIQPDDDTKFAAIASGINEAAIVLNSIGGNNKVFNRERFFPEDTNSCSSSKLRRT
jgi:hypothetical protein